MRRIHAGKRLIAILGLSLLAWQGLTGPVHAQSESSPPPPPAEEQPEVQTKGAVHEGFAEPVVMQVQAGLVAPKPPPPNIQEVPPVDRPQGDQFVWIPGYWSWDADRNDYVWVSACWRAAPPNMSWVPGYWTQVADGYEWVAGFWSPSGTKEIEYLPAPPENADLQPPASTVVSSQLWVPPCWYWVRGSYVRRPGYWLVPQEHWVWVPSHYIWTPRGYVFAAGHWDYTLSRRGVLFAPVYIPRTVYLRAGYRWTPTVVVSTDILTASLFTYPRYNHYCFGDYYGDVSLNVRIFPWFDSVRVNLWYDPIFEHDRLVRGHSNPHWEEQVRHDFDQRREHVELRPARTFREQEIRVARLPEPQRRSAEVARPLNVVVERKSTVVKFERIDTNTRQNIAKRAEEVHTYESARKTWETPRVDARRAAPEAQRPTGPATTPPMANPPAQNPPAVDHRPSAPIRQPEAATPATPAVRGPGPFAPPHPVPVVTQSDRVKVPDSPVVGRPREQGTNLRPPPGRPSEEARRQPSGDDNRPDSRGDNRAGDKGGGDNRGGDGRGSDGGGDRGGRRGN
ncbi:MAG: hypothetical protein NTW19_00490 [Planctomycetota bacterium]|nr:hypothetical protein [Planctomycetota bacterium]